ncbi:hypothetical protein JCM10908_004928 [Rhodotorula pacifica]|uniref:uncharacterized protein n=1 Tax=Rhodotorula pacifica TaxID=1495444 RepID=UPI0031739DE1
MRTMRSLGMGKTTLKHVLTPSGHSSADDSAKSGNEEKKPLTDLEAQALKIRSQRHNPTAPRLSTRRKLYIAGTGLICLVIIIVGIVVGVRLVKSRETMEAGHAETGKQDAEEAAKAVANASLLVEANIIQSSLQGAQPTARPSRGDDVDDD